MPYLEMQIFDRLSSIYRNQFCISLRSTQREINAANDGTTLRYTESWAECNHRGEVS